MLYLFKPKRFKENKMAKSISKDEFLSFISPHASISRAPKVILKEASDAIDLVFKKKCQVGYFPIFNDSRYYEIQNMAGVNCGSIFVGCDEFSFVFETGTEKVSIYLKADASKPETIYLRSTNYAHYLSDAYDDTYIDDFSGEIKKRCGQLSLIVKELTASEFIDSTGKVLNSQITISETEPEFMNLKRWVFVGVADYSSQSASVVAQYFLKTPENEAIYGELNGVSNMQVDRRDYLPRIKFNVEGFSSGNLITSNAEEFIKNNLNSELLNFPRTCYVDQINFESSSDSDIGANLSTAAGEEPGSD